MKIEQSYMVWAGAEHYPTFDHLLDEIKRLGFSKRLPGAGMGRALLQPGTVVYIAHDDGKAEQCKACLKPIVCPECRQRLLLITKLQDELKTFKSGFKNEEAIRASGFARRTVAVKEKKIEAAKAASAGCALCKGEGKAKMGSGGTVRLSSGQTWDYRTFNYWSRQPQNFDAGTVVSKNICDTCGGRGYLPKGAVYGAILIDRIEYQLRPGEKVSSLVDFDDFTIVKSENQVRLSGEREPGGFYAVSGPERNPKANGLGNSLTASGTITGGYTVYGSFVLFNKPIILARGAKRFRGVASYTPKAAKG